MGVETTDLHWLAGLLEGEGCFTLKSSQYPTASGFKTSFIPTIQLNMTDRDVVERAASLMRLRVGGPYMHNKKKNAKPMFYIRAGGRRAAGWMMTLYSLMGKRRKEKIYQILSAYNKIPIRFKYGRPKAKCHPEKPMTAHGLCHNCYMRQYTSGR